MRILLAHKFFHVSGGADTFFFETARILREHGHEVAVFSTRMDGDDEDPYSRYFVPPPSYTAAGTLEQVVGFGDMVYSLPAKRSFSKLIADFRPDVVHAFGIQTHLTPSILRAAHEAGVPVVMSCNDFKHLCPNSMLFHHGRLCDDCRGGRFYKAITNRCSKDSWKYSVAGSIEAYAHKALRSYQKDVDRYLFASRFMAGVTRSFWAKSSYSWSLLRNPFDATRQPAHYGGDHVLYFGRISEEKGVETLVRALARLPDVPAQIVGDGPQLEMLTDLAARLGLESIEFPGARWGSELDAILERARMVVVPSVWHENFPYVILQAFAAGKPVVGSDRGGIPELVLEGRHGTVFPAGDDKALAAAIERLWQDPSRAAAMGRCAKQHVDDQFNDERFYREVIGIYRELQR
jgi:glycosyltransferase involved in cell wall biosynthesis